ncbi:hypothetical protein BS17DRAFT_83275 [Gyrodon lividus]|nr:hypothetical protein BS17DRAFT_83275 [Gyrodon lividus]
MPCKIQGSISSFLFVCLVVSRVVQIGSLINSAFSSNQHSDVASLPFQQRTAIFASWRICTPFVDDSVYDVPCIVNPCSHV